MVLEFVNFLENLQSLYISCSHLKAFSIHRWFCCIRGFPSLCHYFLCSYYNNLTATQQAYGLEVCWEEGLQDKMHH